MRLGEKSKFNIDAADYLILKTLYAPSVHCSYYACFQLMKVVLKSFMGITYDQIDRIIANSKMSGNRPISEHAYIKKEILNQIHKFDETKYRDIKNKIDDLYEYRINSDYKNIEILEDDAAKANKKSKEFIDYIKQNFHV
jgi:uncharacterized protein (UPF0332 family)